MSNNGQNNGLGIIFAFFTGFIAGAVVSLLYAPSSGKDTRQKIRDKSVEAKERTVEFAQQTSDSARRSAQNLMEQGKENVQTIVDSGKGHLHEAGEQVKGAVDTGRKVSADVRAKIASSIPGVGDPKSTDSGAAEEG